MDDNIFEGNFLQELHAHEYHARYPEIDNFPSCGKNSGWIEGSEFSGIVRPAKSSEWPQCRTKPGIENVFILDEFFRVTFVAFFWCCFVSLYVLIFASPDWNSVSPP